MMENTLEQANEQHDEVAEHVEESDDRAQVEQRARDLGWAPQDRWRGDPEAWKDAPEFLEVGEHLLHVSRGNVQRLEERLETERRERAAFEQDMQERYANLQRVTDLAMERQREQILSQAETRKRQAAEVGDMDEYDRADAQQREQLQELDTKAREAEPKQPQNGLDAATQRTIDNWKADNPWYTTDPTREALANGLFNQVEAAMPNADLEKKLEETKRRVMEIMPLDTDTPRRGANAVEGGSRVTTGMKTSKMWSKLPPEAKEAGEKFIKQGLFKDQESYAKDYFAQDD